MQTIKKYANRKLYHTNRKQYITLEGIAALIQAGEPVKVLDNETSEDITSSILTQVVLQARSSAERLPAQVLTSLIRAGGDRIAGVRRSILSTLGVDHLINLEIRHRLESLHAQQKIGDAELQRLEALLTEPSGDLAEAPTQRDIARLHEQLDALSAAVEQLLAERRNQG